MLEATAEKTPTANPEIFSRQFEAYREIGKIEPTDLAELYEQKFNLLFGWRVRGFVGYGGFKINYETGQSVPEQTHVTKELVRDVIGLRLDILKKNKPGGIYVDQPYERTKAMHEKALAAIDGQTRETKDLLAVTEALITQAKAQRSEDSAGISPGMIKNRAGQVLKFVYDNKDHWTQAKQ